MLGAIGDTFKILYDPAAPEQARIDSYSDLWLVPAIWFMLGLTSFVFFGCTARIVFYFHCLYFKRARSYAAYMQNIHHSIEINASKEKFWAIL